MQQRLLFLVLALVLLDARDASAGRGPSARLLRPFAITRVIDEPPGPSGLSLVPATETAVRSRIITKYRDTTHWSVAGQYVVPPTNRILQKDGTLAAPFYPFPGTVVADGRKEKFYDARGHLVQQIAIASAYYSPWFYGFDALSLTPERKVTLAAVLRHVRDCRTARPDGSMTVAGRRAIHLLLGANRCLRNSATAGYASGRADVWLDAATRLVLRLDQYRPGGTLLIRVRTTNFRWL